VEFFSNDLHYRGISSNFSLGGLFVRTNHAFAPGTLIDMRMHLPDGGVAALKGRVRMALKTSVVSLRNGMGIEILERDSSFVDFVESLSVKEGPPTGGKSPSPQLPGKRSPTHVAGHDQVDFLIITCSGCGTGNRVRKAGVSRDLRCGKCGASLTLPA
jgi:PilZ domain